MAVQCAICQVDGTDESWSALRVCGHVYHSACLEQELQYRARCPSCRAKVNPHSREPPHMRVFMQVGPVTALAPRRRRRRSPGADGGSDDDGGTPGGTPLPDIASAQLQMQLMVKEAELQKLRTAAAEGAADVAKLQGEVALLTTSLRKREEKLQQTIGEQNALSRQYKALQNTAANLRVRLGQEESVAARARLALDPSLVGGELSRELESLTRAGLAAPAYFQGMLEARNKQLSSANNRATAAERELSALEAALRETRAALSAAQQRASAAAAAAAAAAPAPTLDLGHGRQRAQQAAGFKRRAAEARAAADWLADGIEEGEELLRAPAGMGIPPPPAHTQWRLAPPAALSAAPGPLPSLRQRMQALTAGAQAAPGARSFPLAAPAGAVALGAEAEREEVIELEAEEEAGGDAGQYSEVHSSDLEIESEPEEQQRQACSRAGRPAPTEPVPSSSQHQQQRAAAGPGGRWAGLGQENDPLTSGSIGSRVLSSLAAAGPSRLALAAAPGPSFIRHPQLATTGLSDSARFIQRGPDGKGGVATAYRGFGGGPASAPRGGGRAGGGDRPPAAKKARGAGAGGQGLCLEHFFKKAP